MPGASGRLLGLDFGAKTVGVAVSDPLGITAQPVETVKRERENKLRQTLARIEALCSTYEVSGIVLGFPRRLDGTEGERCEKTRAFQEDLIRRTELPVTLWDERLTTAEAERVMEAGGLKKEEWKAHSDELAAVLILQSYLDSTNGG